MITHILVDVHGVLTEGDERQKFMSEFEKDFNVTTINHNNFWKEFVSRLDKSQINSQQYLDSFNQIFKTKLTPKKYFELFAQQINPNNLLLNYLSKIDQNYSVNIVSDNLFDLSQELQSVLKYNFSKYQKFYSHDFCLTKSEGLLKIVLEKLNVKPQNCLFIDDSSKNIETAVKLGINSILFENNQQLFTQIKDTIGYDFKN